MKIKYRLKGVLPTFSKMSIVAFLNIGLCGMRPLNELRVLLYFTETRDISHVLLCFRVLIAIYKLPEMLLLLLRSPIHYIVRLIFMLFVFSVQTILLLLIQ